MTTIYIAGYSRCGSTVLGMLLGSHPDIFSAGEISNFAEDWTRADLQCSCGQPYASCEFWCDTPDAASFSEATTQRLRKVEGLSGLSKLLADQLPHADTAFYGAFQKSLFDYARRRSGRSVILDSSKSARLTTGRFLALEKYADETVYVVHLVRRLPATIGSFVRNGSNWALEGRARAYPLPGARAGLGWYMSNASVARVSRELPPERYLFVTYDELVSDPRAVVERIAALTGIDMQPLISKLERNEPLMSNHEVGGNRARLQPQTLSANRKHAGGDDLPLPYRWISGLAEAHVNDLIHRRLAA